MDSQPWNTEGTVVTLFIKRGSENFVGMWFSNFSHVLCLQYAWNNKLPWQGHDIPTPIHHSKNSETAIQCVP